MEIALDLPHVFSTGAYVSENAAVLETLLDALIRIDEIYLSYHAVPTLYRSGVRYDRTEIWDSIPALYFRGYGDCKSLTAARVAELRKMGRNARPVFRFKPQNVPGHYLYHILVLTEDESGSPIWEDPSKTLGMGQDENAPFSGLAQGQAISVS